MTETDELLTELPEGSYIHINISGPEPRILKTKDISDTEAIEWLASAIIVYSTNLKDCENEHNNHIIDKKDMSMYG